MAQHAGRVDRRRHYGGHDTAVEFREKIEAPWFRYWLHGKGEQFPWKASTFQTGSNSWQTYAAWPPKTTATSVYLLRDGTLSFNAPPAGDAYVEYVSDPAKPVPYRQRPISPTYPAGDWRRWEVADQRFVDNRPDVATWVSAPLDRDLVVTGDLSSNLFASTSGTDSDFVVKLIDVYPENAQANVWNEDAGPQPGQYAQSLNGYELPIAMEVRRGRYNRATNTAADGRRPADRDRDASAQPRSRVPEGAPLDGAGAVDVVPADRSQPAEVRAEHLRREGEDFVTATQRVYTSREHPSHIVLPVRN